MKEHKRIIFHPYKMTSDGCKLVAEILENLGVETLRVYYDGKYEPRATDFIVGWGAGSRPEWYAAAKKVGATYINPPDAVDKSICKITSFKAFKNNDVPTPEWTLNEREAFSWSADGYWVCCRQSTAGMDGHGLVLAQNKWQMVYAPLYTKYVANTREFRVYVFNGKVIDILEKHPGDDTENMHIRTEGNGYNYQRPVVSIALQNKLGKVSLGAAEALGLTFAGVDVILGEDGHPYVLETNTAPGIGTITGRRIANAVRGTAGM